MKAVFVILILSPLLWTQAASTGQTAEAILKQADDYSDRYHWDRALPLYAEAQDHFARAADPGRAAYCKIARIRGSAGKEPLQRVYEALDKEIRHAPFDNYPALRLKALFFKADLDTEFDPISVRPFNAKQRRKDWQVILSLARSLADLHLEARAKGELGLVKLLEGDATGSDELGAALWQAKDRGDILSELRFRLAVSSLFLSAGRSHDALGHLERATELAEKIDQPDFFPVCYGKALVLLADRRSEEASPLVQDLLNRSQDHGPSTRAAQALFLAGRLAQEKGLHSDAIQALRQSIQQAGQLGYPRLVGAASLELARIYRSNRDLWKALDSANLGLESSLSAGEPIEPIAHMHVRAGIRADQGRIDEADRLYSGAIRSLNMLLAKFGSSHGRAFLISRMSDLYSDYFVLCLLKLKDSAKAFLVIEQARGRGISDALRSRRTNLVQDTDVSNHRPIELALAKLQAQLWFSEEPQTLRGLFGKIFDLEQRLGPSHESGQPGFDLQILKPVPLSDVQKSLYPDEMILEYILQDTRSICLAITQKATHHFVLPPRRVIEGLVTDYRKEILDGQKGTERARRLHEVLLAPISGLEQRARITVIPDGALHLLPFDALVAPSGKYVVESHLIDYSPAATVTWILRRLPAKSAGRLRFLGVGDALHHTLSLQKSILPGDQGATLQFARLFGSRSEILAISRVLGSTAQTVIRLGSDASEASVKAFPLADFDVLHFAVHGTSEPMFPARSALLLGTDADETEDGFLQAWEISRLRLNADLVVLSACDTGVGRLLEQEGISNLVRSFLLAGARTVVASMWKAEDRSTATLMTSFYSYLAKGIDKGSALRQAKLDFLQKYRAKASPIHWAGPIMVGDSSKPIPLQARDALEEKAQ